MQHAPTPSAGLARARSVRAAAVCLALALGLAAAAQAGPELRLAGSAALTPTTGNAAGSIEFRSDARRGGGERARIVATAESLDVTRSALGALPEFRLVLVPPTGAVADLGALRVNARGAARLRRRDASDLLGARVLRDFEGGTVELRNGSAVVLSATIPRLAVDGAGTSVTVRRVFGKMDYVDKPRASPGAFLVESVTDGAGAHHDRLHVSSRRLDTLPDTLGRFPDYRSYVVDRAGRTVLLGTLELEKVYGAWLRLNQAHAALPSGIKTFEEFDGGRVEVRLGASTVLARAYMVPFPHLADEPKPARSLGARGREELAPPAGGAARAVVEARVSVSETRRVQSFALRAAGLDPAAGPFTVTALAASGTRTPLGSFTAAAPMGAGRLSISTARGGTLPGGADWLSGQTLEVRGADDALALTGSFPTLRP